MSESKILLLCISGLSLIISIIGSGIMFNEASSWEKRKQAIIFLTSPLWGAFAWVGLMLVMIVGSIILPIGATINGYKLVKEAVLSLKRPKNE